MKYVWQAWKLFFVFFVLVSLGTGCALGQARTTATRASEYDIFGGFSYVKSAYLLPDNNFGGTIGADFTKFIPQFGGRITPSVQARGTFAPGPANGEKSLEGGLRLATTVRQRFHPYVDLMVGVGIITFNHPEVLNDGSLYRRDGGFLYVYGGGLTYDTKTNFSALVDYQQQYWNLDQQPPVRFYPGALTFGVLYHIPFKPYKTR